MSEKVLSVVYPIATTYPCCAAIMSIIPNYEKAFDWLYSQYIQIHALCKSPLFSNLFRDTTGLGCIFVDFDDRRYGNAYGGANLFEPQMNFCNYLDIGNIHYSIMEKMRFDVIDMVRYAIESDCYILALVDVFLIKEYSRDDEWCHTVFIFGYDDEKRIIHFGDFLHTGKYQFTTCSYDEFTNAYYSYINRVKRYNDFITIKYNEHAYYKFSMNYICSSIYNYLYPDIKSEKQYLNFLKTNHYREFDKVFTGINLYEYHKKHLKYIVENNIDIVQMQSFQALYDHKQIMLKRFEYLYRKGYLGDNKIPFFKDYNQVNSKVLAIRNNVIKYNLTQNKSILERLPKIFDEARELEKELLKKIFLDN